MSGHRIPLDLFLSQNKRIKDPGSGGTIKVDRDLGHVQLVSAGAEARTLPAPPQSGLTLLLYGKTVAGTITLTVTGGMDEAGTTTGTFTAAGQWAKFVSVEDGSNLRWRFDGGNGFTGPVDVHDTLDVTTLKIGGTAITATAAEINQACDESANTEVVITTNVIAASESGKTFFLSLAAGFTSTLPAPAAGLRYRFIVKTSPTGAPYIIATNGGADVMYGMMLERAGGVGVAGSAEDTFNFVHNQSIIGDWVEFYSDGTNWYYHGMVDVAAGNTVTAT